MNSNMTIEQLARDPEVIRMAIIGARALIERLIGERPEHGMRVGYIPDPRQKPQRNLSAAGRARIVAASKARWARVRAEKAAALAPVQQKVRRRQPLKRAATLRAKKGR